MTTRAKSFLEVASQLACARVPPDIVPALELGRIVALRKLNGGTRGLVVGDFLRPTVRNTPRRRLSATPTRKALSCRSRAHCRTTIASSNGETVAHTRCAARRSNASVPP